MDPGITGRDKMSNLLDAAGRGSKKITLGGREWVLHPLNLNDYCELEEQFGADWQNQAGFRITRYMLYLRLRKCDPSLTPEKVGEMIDETNFDVIQEILGAMAKEEMEETEEAAKNSA